ncbi:uncharacterized protein LOC132393277 [Hypanus sabinus]|uniref:uncharacterized protein LOC132393277 n=1 Tax=Hypanus sabinus TaxID=79690 RepID=UPI0028C4A1D3|nr:uncharacterized protein LOC132393277 [Hypanus sabinus]XP_059824289.1 uncharacterized protein LOC132393277 [Hypanus sabinus]
MVVLLSQSATAQVRARPVKKDMRKAILAQSIEYREGWSLKCKTYWDRNPKAFYRYVKSKRVRHERIGSIKCDSGKVCMEPEETAELLNEHFASVFTMEKDLGNCRDDLQRIEKLEHVDIKRENLLKFLESIKLDESLGLDEMYPRLLWEVREEIAEPLTMIFASSMGTGEVPEDWRVADVVPSFKKGSRDSPGHYRPVSLTSVVGKLKEKILRGRIYEHLERHKMIKNSQHGFVKGRSCPASLIEFFEDVAKNIDEGRAVEVVHMNFSKAFDKIPYARLIEKVRRHGIQGDLALWIQNWLAHRR